jgi:hypothetical protein
MVDNTSFYGDFLFISMNLLRSARITVEPVSTGHYKIFIILLIIYNDPVQLLSLCMSTTSFNWNVAASGVSTLLTKLSLS